MPVDGALDVLALFCRQLEQQIACNLRLLFREGGLARKRLRACVMRGTVCSPMVIPVAVEVDALKTQKPERPLPDDRVAGYAMVSAKSEDMASKGWVLGSITLHAP